MALSLQRKITVLILALYWPAFFISAHIPIPRVVRDANVSDKCLHFLAYLILTFLLWFAVFGNQKVNWRKAGSWCMFFFVVVYGVVDELLQNLVAGRSCDVRDLFVDVMGGLAALILCTFFSFWPAALTVTAMFIFGITNVARANVADLFPIAGVLFYLFAYAAFTILWIQSLKPYASRLVSIQWIVLALAAPVTLLLAVKFVSIVLDRTFVVRDMLISAVGIGTVVASVCLSFLFRKSNTGEDQMKTNNSKKLCVIVFIGLLPIPVSAMEEAKLWEPVTWTFRNPSCSGNPYDLVARATFTHDPDGESIRTELFYDGHDDWTLRFTGIHTGQWSYVTRSADPELDGLRGKLNVRPNPGAAGFLTHFGSKWGWLGTGRAFVPQYVMYCDPLTLYRNPDRIDADIDTFFTGHGFNGFHLAVLCRWFDIEKLRYNEIASPSPNPDPRTFEVLERLIRKVHAAGGVVHIWAWGDEQRRMTPKKWGLNGEVDRRLQRYICARLGPLPGWSMSYGFDLQEWVKEGDLRDWHEYMHDHLGWFHFLAGRAPDLTQICDSLDYSSYQQHRPDYDIYVKALNQYPDKPSFLEDRFRVRKNVYPKKDYDFDRVRRGLWHSTMAGGAANIWGNLLNPRSDGMSHPFPNKDQILTWSRFWKGRFRKECVRDSRPTDGVCLKILGKFLVFYKEDTDTIRMNLSELHGPIQAVAVDTCRRYEEIEIADLRAGPDRIFKAPRLSDWAVAVRAIDSTLGAKD